MSVKTVTCAACDADTHGFTPGNAYVAGLVLATVNGGSYVEFELEQFCAAHRKQFEKQKMMLEQVHKGRAS